MTPSSSRTTTSPHRGVAAAIEAAQRQSGPSTAIELEVDTLDQLDEALEAGATALLLDNMAPPDLRRAVEMTGGRAVLEASGLVTAEAVRAVAETGVNYISSGWITHSAPVSTSGWTSYPALHPSHREIETIPPSMARPHKPAILVLLAATVMLLGMWPRATKAQAPDSLRSDTLANYSDMFRTG